jgi:hypothetical protein
MNPLSVIFSVDLLVLFRWRGETVLTQCMSVSFEEGELAPLYVLEGRGKQPQWKLRQGVGPPTFEMDKRSRSTLIYAPTLRQFGLVLPPSLQSITDAFIPDEMTSRIQRLETFDVETMRNMSVAPLIANADMHEMKEGCGSSC